MTLDDIRRILNCEVLCGDDDLDQEVTAGCGADLMSDVVLAFAKPGTVLLTGLTNVRAARTADISRTSRRSSLSGGKLPDRETIELGRDKGIPLLATRLTHVRSPRAALGRRAAGRKRAGTDPGCRGCPSSLNSLRWGRGLRQCRQSFDRDQRDPRRDRHCPGHGAARGHCRLRSGDERGAARAARHAVELQVTPAEVRLLVRDEGDGIPDIELAAAGGLFGGIRKKSGRWASARAWACPASARTRTRFRIASVVGQGTGARHPHRLRREPWATSCDRCAWKANAAGGAWSACGPAPPKPSACARGAPSSWKNAALTAASACAPAPTAPFNP